MRRFLPVLSVLLALVLVWYGAAVKLNAQWEYDQAARAGAAAPEFGQLVALTMAQKSPVLPAPHQVVVGLWQGLTGQAITSKRSLVYHAWVTLSGTLAGFGIGTGLGVLLAAAIVHNRAMDMSVMPWAIASQTIPILALAPMIIVMMGQFGIQGLLPKAVISAYLSFFPVVVGMVKGLRSPDAMQMDLLRTYYASSSQGFWKLRLPASVPYLFASFKIGISAALVGAIVAELPTGARAGFGARMLVGDQYGNPLVTWAALFAAAITAAALVAIFTAMERLTLRRMGMAAA